MMWWLFLEPLDPNKGIGHNLRVGAFRAAVMAVVLIAAVAVAVVACFLGSLE